MEKQTKKLTRVETGYGITGVTVFFSIMDVVEMQDMITCLLSSNPEVRAESISKIMNLHARMAKAISTEQDSVWSDVPVEE